MLTSGISRLPGADGRSPVGRGEHLGERKQSRTIGADGKMMSVPCGLLVAQSLIGCYLYSSKPSTAPMRSPQQCNGTIAFAPSVLPGPCAHWVRSGSRGGRGDRVVGVARGAGGDVGAQGARRADCRAFPPSHALLTSTPKQSVASQSHSSRTPSRSPESGEPGFWCLVPVPI